MSKTSDRSLYHVLNISDEPPLSVTDAGVTAYTLTAGLGYVIFQNNGTKPVWLGGSTVDPSTSRGYKLYPTDSYSFENIRESFKIHFTCAATESTTVSITKG